MAKKKTNKMEKKKRDLLLSNFIIIMFFGVLIAMVAHVTGIATLIIKTGGEEEFLVTSKMVMKTNVYMNTVIACVVGLYSLLHVINYGMYLFGKDKALKIAMVVDFLIFIVCFAFKLDLEFLILFLVPVLSGFVYLKVLKLEE